MNRDEATSRQQQRQALSALLDGEAAQADEACSAWCDDPQARADWHTYQLIGELLRTKVGRSPQPLSYRRPSLAIAPRAASTPRY